MDGINNNKHLQIISESNVWDFQKTLNDKQGFSVFSAFLSADKHNENGENERDWKLTDDEIDDFFAAIGNELKEKFSNWMLKRADVETIYNSIVSLNLDNEYTVYNKQAYDKAVKSINQDNIEDVLFSCGLFEGRVVEQLQMPSFKDKTTAEYVQKRTKKEIQSDCKHVQQVMQKWCKARNIDTKELDNKKFYPDILDEYAKLMHNYREVQRVKEIMTKDVSENMLKAVDEKYEQSLKDGIELTTDTPPLSATQKKLQNLNNETKAMIKTLKSLDATSGGESESIKELENSVTSSNTFLNDNGNGVFDKPARQLTGNCWLLAGINSLISTDFGKQFLEKNIIKDDEKHIFAVHLQEAENKNLPKPKGDGIYTFSEKEVLEAQNLDNGLVSGEGDVTAFALAIEAYLKESGTKLKEDQEKYQDGGSGFRLFELITGLSAPKLHLGQHNEVGIQREICVDIGDGETKLPFFDKVYDMAEKKNAAIVLSYNDHVYSVVGVKDNYILIQESNLSVSDADKFELIADSYPPTFKVNKEVFEKIFQKYSALKWEM